MESDGDDGCVMMALKVEALTQNSKFVQKKAQQRMGTGSILRPPSFPFQFEDGSIVLSCHGTTQLVSRHPVPSGLYLEYYDARNTRIRFI